MSKKRLKNAKVRITLRFCPIKRLPGGWFDEEELEEEEIEQEVRGGIKGSFITDCAK